MKCEEEKFANTSVSLQTLPAEPRLAEGQFVPEWAYVIMINQMAFSVFHFMDSKNRNIPLGTGRIDSQHRQEICLFPTDRPWVELGPLSSEYRGAPAPEVRRLAWYFGRSTLCSAEVKHSGHITPLLHTPCVCVWVCIWFIKRNLPFGFLLVENIYKYDEIHSKLLPICTVATAVKAMFKCCGTVSGWDSNSHSKSLK
jgi:hypothetical protein